jgi:putative ABC transport system ATP-binding protein
MSSSPLLHLSGVSKIFLTEEIETHALSRVNMQVSKGEFVAIAGPSGCGKSTLLSILGLLDTPSEGSYRLGGDDVSRKTAAERASLRNERIGFIFQNFNLIGDLSVAENVALPLTYRGLDAKTIEDKVAASLDRVGMSGRKSHHPSQLSGGQQQRVAVARALVGDPLILLADEPTGNLDSKNGEAVMDLLAELHAGGATICMVTHDDAYVKAAQRAVHLFDGRVVGDAVMTPPPADTQKEVA